MKFKEIISDFKDHQAAWADRWGLTEEPTIQNILIKLFNITITKFRNFNIGYEDPEEFEIAFKNLVDEHTPTFLKRARFLNLEFNFLKNKENWGLVQTSSSDFKSKNQNHQGYQGYNSADDEAFRKDWADSKGQNNSVSTSNPLLIAQNLKEAFKDEIKKFEHDLEDHLQLIY